MRSGNRPTRNTAATDQSPPGPDAVGKPEDSDPDRSMTAVQPTDQPSASVLPETVPPDSVSPAPVPPDAVPPGGGPEPGDQPGPAADLAAEDLAAEDLAAEDLAAEDLAAEDLAGEPGPASGGPGPGTAAPKPARPGRAGALAAWARVSARIPGAGRLRFLAARQHRQAGGRAFARLTVMPAILVMAWLLPGIPLLLAGVFLPVPMVLIAGPLVVALASYGLRTVPARWPRARPGTSPAGASPAAASPAASPAAAGPPRQDRDWPAWWGLAGTVAVAAGFALWQFLFNSESVIVLRDPGAYLQTGYWIAQHGSLPISKSLAAFGGAHPGLSFSSIGFYSSGSSVVPGLMSGLPLLLAGGFWVHGTSAAAAMGPILGGLAVLAFGGLVGRLVGPRWAPAGALVLAFTLPEQYTSRGPFSETVVQILLFGGLCLVADALTLGDLRQERAEPQAADAPSAAGSGRHRDRSWAVARWFTPQRAMMALGGLALGLAATIRVDGLLDVLPAIPFAGILVARRSTTVVAFCIGLTVGVGYGLADGYLLARPFLDALQPMPELIGLIAAWLIAMTLAGVEMLRLPGFRKILQRFVAARPLRWLPEAGGLLAVAALIGLAIRPYLQTVRQPASRASATFVASLQRFEHLPVDPGRLYAEDTLYWVIWYVGIPAVLLGGFGVALLLRRGLRALISWRDPSGAMRIWAMPLMVICCGSAAVLWQPQTVPDQPWASRRLVPLVLPGLILCAIWASAWLRQRARSRGASQTAASVVAACCVAALMVPTVATTFGLGLTHTGPGGSLRPSADGLALKRTGQGEVGAVNALCSSLGPSASVVIVDPVVAGEFTQVIRGMCGAPVASMSGQSPQAVQNVLSGISRAGRRPVLLGARLSEVSAYGGSPVRVVDLATTQDPHTLAQPPTAPWPARYVIWMTTPGGFGARA